MPQLPRAAKPRAIARNSKVVTATRGRPPRKVFINVLVRASSRSGLALLKNRSGLRSQGEVIDELVARALKQRAD